MFRSRDTSSDLPKLDQYGSGLSVGKGTGSGGGFLPTISVSPEFGGGGVGEITANGLSGV